MSKPLQDRQAREQALDVGQSFIVQAPAGSGKTGLLTLRYLRLLGVCEEPENVLAITFTRKATSEMRNRIIEALGQAASTSLEPASPVDEHERQYLELAAAVLARDRERNWRIMENPSRLRVQTIDGFCNWLAGRMPVLSGSGGASPRAGEELNQCFSAAIAATLAQLDGDGPLGKDVDALLRHLDNDYGRVERLLKNLLHKRDQWLHYILEMGDESDDPLELRRNTEEMIREILTLARQALAPHEAELTELLNYAASNFDWVDASETREFEALDSLPGTTPAALDAWFLLVDMLLTADGNWRKRITANQGFPASDSHEKHYRKRMTEFLESVSGDQKLPETLALIRLLQPPEKTSRQRKMTMGLESWEDLLAFKAAAEQPTSQWSFLAALARVLRHLSAELRLAFANFQQVDYTEISTAASAALGDEEQPTDLALTLDYRIAHILVDEFQDTSVQQKKLLQQLTAGWQPGDGRSLFLVGDPMQSCYAFRNANVGIYLDVQERGLGSVMPQALRLTTNFRSQSRVVDWVNKVFEPSFPTDADASRGAVPYNPVVAQRSPQMEFGVQAVVFSSAEDGRDEARQSEAGRVVEHIMELREKDPEASIAVLVRTRSHLQPIIPRLRENKVPWISIDIDPLGSVPIVSDLLSLTRALLDAGDRVAWLALLRAPWCGLKLVDLHALTSHAGKGSIYGALGELERMNGLSADARQRLQPVSEVMTAIMEQRYRHPLRTLVESAWQLLGGPAFITTELERDSAGYYLDLLEQHESAGGLADLEEFQTLIATAYVPTADAENSARGVHLMTIHGAKGLEFDHVILPGLGNTTRRDSNPLLRWHESLSESGRPRLFIATLPPSGVDSSPLSLYKLLAHEQKLKNRLEETRLLYIAVTRARKSVLMLSPLTRGRDGKPGKPRTDSLLARIWETLQQQRLLNTVELEPDPLSVARKDPYATPPPTLVRRIARPLDLSNDNREILAALSEAEIATDAEEEDGKETDVEAVQLAATVGTLIHGFLENYVHAPRQEELVARLTTLRDYWKLHLQRVTASASKIDEALDFIEGSLRDSVSHRDLRWIFAADLQDSACELELSVVQSGRRRQYLIDRTFIDSEGVRWIIDYKTGAPGPEQSVEDFISAEQGRYRQQLAGYRELFREMEERPCTTALFFTAIPALVKYDDARRPSAEAD